MSNPGMIVSTSAQGLYPQPPNTMRAASASLCTSKGDARTTSSRRRCRSWSTWNIAAPADARRTPVTAPASSSRCPTRFLRTLCAGNAAAAGEYGAGLVFLPHDESDRNRIKDLIAEHRPGGRAASARMARRPDGQPPGGPERSRHAAGLSAPVHRSDRTGRLVRRADLSTEARHAKAEASRAKAERKLYVIRKRIEHAVDTLKINPLSRRFFYIVSLSANTLTYKGMLTARQLAPMFPDLGDPGADVRARPGAPAIQHQHVPVVAAGPPVPADRAQRRDQHAARQHQLDEGPPGAARERSLRRRPREAAPGHSRRRQRHCHLRQRPRASRARRPFVAARDPDDDSRALERERGDGPRSQGVLRVSLLVDGAVGRSGVHRLHRRHGDRRGARSQRAAAVALLRDQGRPGHHGVGSRRARRSAREHPHQGAPPAGPHLPRRHRQAAASSTTTRSSSELAAEHPYREWLDQHLVDIDDLPRRAPWSPTTRPS